MGKVISPDIKRPNKYGRYGEIIDLIDDMTKQYYDIAPQADAVQALQSPVILKPLDARPAIDTIKSITTPESKSRFVLGWGTDIYGRQQSKLKTIIEMFPSGTICKIHIGDTDTFRAVIHEIKFSTADFEPALHIEFFKIEDIFAMPAETSPDTLSQYPVIQSCVIYNPGQIESIDSSDAAEMSRELIKNEMLAIKKQIAALKDNLRRLNRLRNSGSSTSSIVSEIDQKYRAFSQRLEMERFMKRANMGPITLPFD